jgi:fucose permease
MLAYTISSTLWPGASASGDCTAADWNNDLTRSALARYRPRFGLILLSYIAFISLGLPDGLLGVAWPSIRATFGRPIDSLGIMLFAGTAGYLTSSFSSGRLIRGLGVGKVLALSCAATGLGLIGYSLAPAWWVMVLLAVMAGLGAGAIDAGLNTYVAAHFGEGLMQWLHASYGIGVMLGPIIMTLGIKYTGAWRAGYALVGMAQLMLAAAFAFTLRLWEDGADRATVAAGSATAAGAAAAEPTRLTDYRTSVPETLRQPAVWLSMLLFFLYTGSEATLGYWTFSLLTESRGIPLETAGFWAGSYWAMFTIGRIVAGVWTNRVTVHALVRGSLLAALSGAVLLWWNPVAVASLLAVIIIGFAIAPIFPGLVSGTSARVGARYAANTIGMQIAAAGLSAAVVPALAGVLARRASLEIIPAFLVFLFVMLLVLYGVSMRWEGRPARQE